jgi:hypothetical protein
MISGSILTTEFVFIPVIKPTFRIMTTLQLPPPPVITRRAEPAPKRKGFAIRHPPSAIRNSLIRLTAVPFLSGSAHAFAGINPIVL